MILATDKNGEPVQCIASQWVDRSRLRRFAVDASTLVSIFVGRVRLEGACLPEDAHVTGVSHDGWNNRICVFIHSMTFEPVMPGDLIPDFGAVTLVACGSTEGVAEAPPADSWRDRSSLL